MNSLTELDFNWKYFLDKTTIIYGESGTGKSFVIIDILYQLKPHADQIIVFSPTDRQNHTYDKGIVPIPFIHYTITGDLLNDIWERQEALATVYSKANKPDVLRRLFEKIPNNEDAKRAIENTNRKLRQCIEEIDNTEPDEATAKAKIADVEKECNKLITMIYKHLIKENSIRLGKMQLTEEERYTVKYASLNPRLVVILDDCTDLLKKFKSHPVMQKMFYQGRHSFITTIIACHTDKALDAELKKNSFVNMYTEETCARACFDRKSADLGKEAKERAVAACRQAFTPLAKFQKLAWIRDEKKFYKFTATKRTDFRFGSPVIWDYCRQIQAESGAISPNNKFIHDFAQ